jgi:hypothetical protein
MSEQNLPSEVGIPELNLPPDALQYLSEEAAAAEAGERENDCACTLFAVVNPNGTLARAFGAVSSQQLGVGTYSVIFKRNIRNCAYEATIGTSGNVGVFPVGQISVSGLFGNPNKGVFVQTANSAGTLSNFGFHLAVHCRPEDD